MFKVLLVSICLFLISKISVNPTTVLVRLPIKDKSDLLSALADSRSSLWEVAMVNNSTDIYRLENNENFSFIHHFWFGLWLLLIITSIGLLILKIGNKYYHNMEPMCFIQLLFLVQLLLFYVEVLVRSLMTTVLQAKVPFIMELLHFWILMNRNILLLLQQGNVMLYYLLTVNTHA